MATNKQADLVLKSSAVFTGQTDEPVPASVAIAGQRILAVGDHEAVAPYIGPETDVRDLGDRLVMPGFNDFHLHLFLGSLSQNTVSLADADSEHEAAKLVRRYADAHPDEEWIIGFRWYHVHWDNPSLPHRSTLDALLPDRPVFLFNEELHGAWVNSVALERMGIDRDTPDPSFGEIARDEKGEPTGFLYETAAGLAQSVFDNLPRARQEALLESFLEQAARLGVTSVTDILTLPGLETGDPALYQEYERQGRLTTRIHFLATLDGNLDHARKLQETYRSDKVRLSGLKQFLDGVPTTYTGYLVEPYSDKPDTHGITLIPPEQVRQWVIDADAAGFRVRLHACGDGAVRLGLDCFEAARDANGVRDSRHTIEHIEVIHPDDIDRFAELGVIASMQPEHMAPSERFADNVYLERLGPERDPYTWPIRTLLDRGAPLALGTDFPVVGLDPMAEIYRAVTRLHDDGEPAGGWNPQERISLAEALRAYTMGSARGVFREDELGTLEAGKLADIVVLDRNLFARSAAEIRECRPVLTVMDGQVVYAGDG